MANGGLNLKSLEALHITDALRRNHGNRKAAAEELGIHPSTLFRKIKELGVDTPGKDGRSRSKKQKQLQQLTETTRQLRISPPKRHTWFTLITAEVLS